jgi:NAD(P)-dependent dehydrogenase (short-subunit alcohol dehydrogenase family)
MRTASLDVTDVAAAGAAVDAPVKAFRRLNVVVNNTGYGNVGSIEDTEEADFRAQVETNFFGVVNVTRAATRFSKAKVRPLCPVFIDRWSDRRDRIGRLAFAEAPC